MHLKPNVISAPNGSLAIMQQGAQVLGWVPAGEDPVIWVSQEAKYLPGTTVRGGVPICFPWFGSGRAQMPHKHGSVRFVNWDEMRLDVEDDNAVAVYTLTESSPALSDALKDLLEQPFRATFCVCAGRELLMSLDIENTGDEILDFEVALHTYFCVNDVRQARLEGMEGASYFDAVAGREEWRKQESAIEFFEETDRIYDSNATVRLVDPAGGRTLEVSKGGAPQTVVWNPWSETARAMNQFGADEWIDMVCIEATAAREHAIQIAPGQKHTIWQRIRVLHD